MGESTAKTTEPAPAVANGAVAAKPSAGESLISITAVLENAVKLKETRLMSGRIMRLTAAIRKDLNGDILSSYISSVLSAELPSRAYLLQATVEAAGTADTAAMQTDDIQTPAPAPASVATETSTPEVELYAYLLLLMFTSDKQLWQLTKSVAVKAVERVAAFNRRTLDVIAARICYYYSLAHEHLGELQDIRGMLLALHRTSTLRHDVIGQETLLNLLLRNYLHYNLYDQAEAFRSKAQREEVWRSHQQYTRYLFYLGRIRAVQLEYSEARDCLQQASRKAPATALGFRVAADKWLTLVRLLLGEVPDRQELVAPGLALPLRPYFELTQAVRTGDTQMFSQVAQTHAAVFKQDATLNLITRLHHNVLRTGLRRISLAYSRISLEDVASRLHLSSAEDAASIVAKAVRDGAVDAVIDYETGAMVSRDTQDVYTSGEPAEAFHARVAFCLDLHNEAVKALRYEPDAHKRRLEKPEQRAERLAAEAELAKAMEEEEDE
ncbi:26S proteasome regulatory subunit [Haematococcus lacustris]